MITPYLNINKNPCQVNGYRMDSLLPKEEKRGINKTFVVAILIAVVLIAGLILLFVVAGRRSTIRWRSLSPVHTTKARLNLQSFPRTSSSRPTRRTVQSPTGLGTISMYHLWRRSGIRRHNDHDPRGECRGYHPVQPSSCKKNACWSYPFSRPALEPGETIPITIAILTDLSKDDDRTNIRWKVTAIRAASK